MLEICHLTLLNDDFIIIKLPISKYLFNVRYLCSNTEIFILIPYRFQKLQYRQTLVEIVFI